MNITWSIRVPDDLRFEAAEERIVSGLVDTLSLVSLKLQAHIVSQHLSGRPPGLNQITGLLAGSVLPISVEVDGRKVIAGVEAARGKAFYGKFHEYGGTFEVLGRRRNAKTFSFTSTAHPGRLQLTKDYKITFPERSFMRSSLEEMRDQIVADIQAAVIQAVKADATK